MGWQDRPYNSEGSYSQGLRFGFTPPSPVALWIMVACFLTFILQSVTAMDVRLSPLNRWGDLSFLHYRAFTQPWRWITYQYLHADAMHIFFNLLGIYFFLPPLERLWGGRQAFLFYTMGGIAAGIVYGIVTLFAPSSGLIGASGSILAALGACALLFPEKQVLFIIFPIPIRVLAVLLALLYVLTTVGHRDLSNAAHLGGLVFGVCGPLYGAPLIRRFSKRRHQGRIRRLVEADQEEQETVDRILQKVHDQGMNALSRSERRILKKATEHQRQRDLELARARRPGS